MTSQVRISGPAKVFGALGRRGVMLPASPRDIISIPGTAPMVVCVVDAEEEFDWSKPFATANNSVTNMAAQERAQAIFRRFGLVPTYAVDYPVAAQEQGYGPLRDFLQGGQCEIGAQLHPWVTPPFEESIGETNSFACNLPYDLQARKTENLTAIIEKNFGIRPRLFRTGRYGAGPDTVRLLEQFGYDIDCSVLPGPAITPSSPDFSNAPSRPYWLDSSKRILEIPVTASMVGPLRVFRGTSNRIFTSAVIRQVKLPAILARTRLLYRARITPEGHSLDEAKELTRTLYRAGQRVFALSYHSPSLSPGRTPYTRNQADVERFLSWIEGYLDFFTGEMSGVPSSVSQIRDMASKELPHERGMVRAGSSERGLGDLVASQERRRTILAQSQGGSGFEEEKASRRPLTAFPRICAVIPAHNSQATLARALDSVRAQTLPVSQTIVVDDASSDATGEVARNYPGLNVEVVRLDKNVGAAAARNRGVTAAHTELVAFLDADDEWLPTKLEKQAAVITGNNKVSYVSCGSDLISPDGVNTGDIYRGQRVVAGELAWKALLRDNYITTPSVLVWRDALLKAGGFDKGLKIAEDQDMWIRLAESGELGYVPESLVHVHERRSSLSGGSFNDQLAYTLPMIEGHITRLASKLSQHEINNIRGRRFLRLGQLACHRGASKVGRSLIWRSILLGHKPWEGLLFLATTTPLALWLKQVLLRR